MLFSLSDESFLQQQRLHVWRKIGEGSFSKVYVSQLRAITSTTTNIKPLQLIATKVINKNRVSAKFVEKFLPRELDVLLKLRHPFVVQVYGLYQNGHKVYINMEYAENGDLFTYLRNNTLTEPQIRSWITQILFAFRYMHGVGVVHRDLKCENILLTGNYNVRVADFGFARFVSRGRHPGADTLCGTLTYSSPELLLGTRPYNPVATDVWAVGVVLFMMANNVPPFRDGHKEEMYKKQLAKEYTFRKVLARSEPLRALTATFLEPEVSRRTRINRALRCQWIRSGTPTRRWSSLSSSSSSKMSHSTDAAIHEPVITADVLKESAFQYQIVENVRAVSAFNETFVTASVDDDDPFLR